MKPVKMLRDVPTASELVTAGTLLLADLHPGGSGKANLFDAAGRLVISDAAVDCFEIVENQNDGE